MVHVWSINSGERFQGHHGPLVKYSLMTQVYCLNEMFRKKKDIQKIVQKSLICYEI